MAAIKVADIFAQIGARVDVRNINRFQRRLDGVKRQLLSVRRIMREVGASRVAPITNLSSVRSLNAELARTQRLVRSISAQGPVRVRGSGGGFGGGGASSRSGGGRGREAIGAAAGLGLARNNAFTRQFAGGFAAAFVTRQIFGATRDLQAIETGLRATLKPGQELGEVLTFLKEESNRLGFEFRTSALEYAKLAAAGNAAGMATEDIQNIFLAAQESARVFGLTTAETEGVLKAFTQIISKGKVTAEELRNQLGDRLPAAVPLFAKALGVTTEQLSEMLEKGEILANENLPKFATTVRETFAEEVPAAAERVDAALERFRTTLFFLFAEIGKSGVGDFFKIMLELGTSLIRLVTPAFKVFAGVIRILVTPLQAVARLLRTMLNALKSISPVAEAMPGVIMAIVAGLFAMNTQLARTALGWLRAAAPLILFILLLDEIVTAFQGGETAFGKFNEFLQTLTQSSSSVLTFVGSLATLLNFIVESLTKIVAAMVQIIAHGQGVKEAFAPLVEDIGTGASNVGGFLQDSFLRAIGRDERADQILQNRNRTTANITVNAAPGQSEEQIAQMVADKITEASDVTMRTADAAFPEVE